MDDPCHISQPDGLFSFSIEIPSSLDVLVPELDDYSCDKGMMYSKMKKKMASS